MIVKLEDISRLEEAEELAGRELDAAFAANNKDNNIDTYTRYLKARKKWKEARAAYMSASLGEEVFE